MELRFARARPLFRLRSAYADPKVPFRGIYETDRGNGKAAVSRCRQASRCVAVSRCGYVADVPPPGDCHATATPSLAMTRVYGAEPAQAVSRCGQACRCGYVADVPLPGDCHATATPSLAMTRRYGCTRNLLSLPPSGEGGLPKHCEGKTDEGKTTLRFYKVYSPHPSLGALALALVPPSPKGGEGFSSCHPITILLARFQPYLSAQPTVGRFAL